ncbi:PI4KB kinase, partial [Polyodon spathula]|nr:PI4KB kinase [Polyodon spathula]
MLLRHLRGISAPSAHQSPGESRTGAFFIPRSWPLLATPPDAWPGQTPCAQASVSTRSCSPLPPARQVKKSRQARVIMDMKTQISRIMELLERQQAPLAPAAGPRVAPPSPSAPTRVAIPPPDLPWENRTSGSTRRFVPTRTCSLSLPRGGSPLFQQRWSFESHGGPTGSSAGQTEACRFSELLERESRSQEGGLEASPNGAEKVEIKENNTIYHVKDPDRALFLLQEVSCYVPQDSSSGGRVECVFLIRSGEDCVCKETLPAVVREVSCYVPQDSSSGGRVECVFLIRSGEDCVCKETLPAVVRLRFPFADSAVAMGDSDAEPAPGEASQPQGSPPLDVISEGLGELGLVIDPEVAKRACQEVLEKVRQIHAGVSEEEDVEPELVNGDVDNSGPPPEISEEEVALAGPRNTVKSVRRRQKNNSAKQSWLLRLFESKLFDISMAISYLYNSKEPGVQAYIGNRLFSFRHDEVDSYLPQLLNMYIHMDEDVGDAIKPYVVYRCRQSINFSLQCAWLLGAFSSDMHISTQRHSRGTKLRKLILSDELKPTQRRREPLPPAGPGIEHSLSPSKRTHQRSKSDATVSTSLSSNLKRTASNPKVENQDEVTTPQGGRGQRAAALHGTVIGVQR